MTRDRIVRTALWISVVYNAIGTWALLAPASWAGRLAATPAGVPFLYRAELAWVVALFGAVYLWLALRARLDTAVVPILVLGAVGKAGFFGIYVLAWLRGELPGAAAASASGDLLLAGIFAWWAIARPRSDSAATSRHSAAA